MASPSPRRGVAECVSDLQRRGPQALAVLPDAAEWSRTSDDDRHRLLDGLRIELYALSALLSDAVVHRAIRDRPSFPPYGLARSKFSDWGMLSVFPDPYEEGSLDSFHTFWKAFVDTVVLHLHREFSERRRSGQAWTVEGIGRLLPAFAALDAPDQQPRKRDAVSFVYGGLQFGTSVSVQLAEVGSRVLRRDAPELTSGQRAAVLGRSTGPAYRLAALSLDQALSVYEGLLSSAADTPEQGRTKPGWLDADQFTVQHAHGEPWRITLEAAHDVSPADASYTRLGCPARLSPEGEETPIGALWSWCVDVAGDAGLLR